MALSIMVTLSCQERRQDSAGASKSFSFDAWSALLERSFFFKSTCEPSAEAEQFLKKVVVEVPRSETLVKPKTTTKPPSTETFKPLGPLQARDPQSRAEALPLAHYRPTDGPIWKDGDAAKVQIPSTMGVKPAHSNCKKPPKPPRHPGRAASLDSSAGLAAQRCARKSRDRAGVAAKRKARSSSASANAGLTPLVALFLTLGFGVLMVFQGVFVQTNTSNAGSSERPGAEVADATQFSFSREDASSDHFYQIEPLQSATSNVDPAKTGGSVSNAFYQSMKELPWSRSSLASQANVASR